MSMTKERKIILTIGAVLLFAASIYRFYPLIQDFMGGQDEIEVKKDTLSRYYRIAKQNRVLENEVIALNRVLERSEFIFFNATKTSLAAVDIKNILTEIADRNSVDIQLMRDLPVEIKKDENPIANEYPPIRVQIAFTSNINQLKKMLYQIETHDRLLSIVEAKFNIGYGKKKEMIQSRLTVQGFMKNEV